MVAWLWQSGATIHLNGSTRETVRANVGTTGAVMFGSDQGRVGQFNELMVNFVLQVLGVLTGIKTFWVVVERVKGYLHDTTLLVVGSFEVLNFIAAIASLVRRILIEIETQHEQDKVVQVYLIHNLIRAKSQQFPLKPLDQERCSHQCHY
jgi:F-type H+-transporting ATPase subunit gamma